MSPHPGPRQSGFDQGGLAGLADAVQARHLAAILGNRLTAERRWGQPCRSYLVCLYPDRQARRDLTAIQRAIGAGEPSLLRVPEGSLHVSVAWLLPVHEEFGEPKDALWARHGPGWVAGLTEAVAGLAPFRLRFRRLIATDAAVIAVADAPNPVTRLRPGLLRRLWIPRGFSSGGLVHITLFRYAGPLAAPHAFLRRLAQTPVDVSTAAAELSAVQELVFPSLDYQIMHRFPLREG